MTSASFAYDIAGRETRRDYGNGIRIETGYDDQGRVEFIRESRLRTGEILRAKGYAYDERGRLSASIDEKALVSAYRYDEAGRLVAAFYPYEGGTKASDAAEAQRLGASSAATAIPPAERWEPDSALALALERALSLAVVGRKSAGVGSRLVWAQRYTYDHNGNRLSKSTGYGRIVYRYGPEDELLSAGGAQYRYDADGRMLESIDLAASATYAYDARGRAVTVDTISAKGTATSVSYEYDALGRRVQRLEAGVGGTRTLYDGLGFDEAMSLTLGASGSRAGSYGKQGGSGKYDGKYRYEGPSTGSASGTGAQVLGAERNSLSVKGMPTAFTTASGSYYLGQDRLGSTESLTDDEGKLFERLEYDAFGSVVSGNFEAASLWGYAGKRYDPATGSYDYGFRDYAPSQGRFTTVDPIRDGSNWYAYCDADPVNYVDLWGLSASDTTAWKAEYTVVGGGVFLPDAGGSIGKGTVKFTNLDDFTGYEYSFSTHTRIAATIGVTAGGSVDAGIMYAELPSSYTPDDIFVSFAGEGEKTTILNLSKVKSGAWYGIEASNGLSKGLIILQRSRPEIPRGSGKYIRSISAEETMQQYNDAYDMFYVGSESRDQFIERVNDSIRKPAKGAER